MFAAVEFTQPPQSLTTLTGGSDTPVAAAIDDKKASDYHDDAARREADAYAWVLDRELAVCLYNILFQDVL